MSVIASKTRKDLEFAATSAHGDHAPTLSAVSAATRFARKAAVKSVRLFMHAAAAITEARMQWTMIEAELYHGRYKHSSKNDDDQPITSRPRAVSQRVSCPASRPSSLHAVWRRTARWAVATSKRAYPIIVVCAICATIVAAAIALRLAIWLPTFRY